MAKSSEIKLSLPSVDDLFSTQEERDDLQAEKVVNIPIDEISDYPEHPFKVQLDEKLFDMAESIVSYGVLVPAIVRPLPDGGYQMVSGHRRKAASFMAQKEELPCIVRDMTDDEAVIIMVDSNLQREQILPSEKAFAYKMKFEALKHQGKSTLGPMVPKLDGKRSTAKIGEESGESYKTVQRYIRLTKLIPEILTMVDENRMAFRPAVEISYLVSSEQKALLEFMKSEDCTPSLSQAQELKKISQKRCLEDEDIYRILSADKPNQREKIVLKADKYKKYFSKGMTTQEKEAVISEALELWYKNRIRQSDRAR